MRNAGGYIRIYALTINGFSAPFWPLGTTIYIFLCPKSGFQLLRASIPSIQKLQNEINFFHLCDRCYQSVVTTRLSHSHLLEITQTHLIYTPFLYFNRIKIYTRLITHETQVNILKKIISAVFDKIKKKENFFMEMSTSDVPISTKS